MRINQNSFAFLLLVPISPLLLGISVSNNRIIYQHDGDYTANRYFYLHDRLGSVRQMIYTSGSVKNRYTFEPFGEMFSSEKEETISNPFKFTGQYHDHEIDEYYLRARQYDPVIHRFTSRDPVRGKFKEPMTLHVYLYCLNDPINHTDPTGNISIVGTAHSMLTSAVINAAICGALGGSPSDMLRAGIAGGVGSGIRAGLSSFSSVGLISQLLSKHQYAPRLFEMLARSGGAMVGTIIYRFGEPGSQTWNDAEFLSKLFGAMVFASVSDVGEAINPDWYNATVDFTVGLAWNKFIKEFFAEDNGDK